MQKISIGKDYSVRTECQTASRRMEWGNRVSKDGVVCLFLVRRDSNTVRRLLVRTWVRFRQILQDQFHDMLQLGLVDIIGKFKWHCLVLVTSGVGWWRRLLLLLLRVLGSSSFCDHRVLLLLLHDWLFNGSITVVLVLFLGYCWSSVVCYNGLIETASQANLSSSSSSFRPSFLGAKSELPLFCPAEMSGTSESVPSVSQNQARACRTTRTRALLEAAILKFFLRPVAAAETRRDLKYRRVYREPNRLLVPISSAKWITLEPNLCARAFSECFASLTTVRFSSFSPPRGYWVAPQNQNVHRVVWFYTQ